jgi:hypothetical protein
MITFTGEGAFECCTMANDSDSFRRNCLKGPAETNFDIAVGFDFISIF